MIRGVVIICFSAPLHLKDETGGRASPVWREKRGGSARVANVTGNKNRPSGSRKLQSLQAASTDSETDNMYGRHGGIEVDGKEVSLTTLGRLFLGHPRVSTTKDDNRYRLLGRTRRKHSTIDFYRGIENCAKSNQ